MLTPLLERLVFSRFVQLPVLSFLGWRLKPILRRSDMTEFVRPYPVQRREIAFKVNTLLDLCKNRRVAHFGFVDYPFTRKSMFTADFLHNRLKEVAASVIGIDYSAEAVDFYRNETGDADVYKGDIYYLERLRSKLSDREIFLLGEIMEHLDNPGLALISVRNAMPDDALLVITVPNAFNLHAFSAALGNVELVHPDHVAWYSPGTLAALIGKNGFRTERMILCQTGCGTAITKEFGKYPFVAEGIVGVFRKKNASAEDQA